MDEEEIHFCNICDGPPTYKRLIKRSSLPFLHEEDQLDEHETYDDYCTCIAGLGGESVQVGTSTSTRNELLDLSKNQHGF